MQINVSQLLRDSIGSSRDYKINETIDSDNDSVIIPVKGEVKLTRTNRSILVQGKIHVSVEVICARCLDIFSYPLTLNIEEEFFPTLDTSSGYTIPPPEEQDSFTIDEHQILDLTEAIRQYTLLAIPMKSLCREACNGHLL
ncbi:MAG: DUF177 domain-containing protein [Dehalococcoidales bacterium]|nr:DUF177 domain-containing protein [Dehalococcoidales bacterium]